MASPGAAAWAAGGVDPKGCRGEAQAASAAAETKASGRRFMGAQSSRSAALAVLSAAGPEAALALLGTAHIPSTRGSVHGTGCLWRVGAPRRKPPELERSNMPLRQPPAAAGLPQGNDLVTAVLLSAVAGYVDTAGFLALFGLFTSHVTGNLVTAGAALARRAPEGVIARLAMIPIFMLSVAATTLV